MSLEEWSFPIYPLVCIHMPILRISREPNRSYPLIGKENDIFEPEGRRIISKNRLKRSQAQ
jgi:hypothetical protein